MKNKHSYDDDRNGGFIMDSERIHSVVEAQRAYFRSGATLPVKFRIEQLKRLKQAVLTNRQKLEDAL